MERDDARPADQIFLCLYLSLLLGLELSCYSWRQRRHWTQKIIIVCGRRRAARKSEGSQHLAAVRRL